MKRKRLDRDKWGFQGFPYYQLRIDKNEFHGTAALIRLTDGDYYYWNMKKAGKIAVCGAGMIWLQFIPDGKHRVVTVKFLEKNPDNTRDISVWYVDIIERTETDNDGVIVFIDKYLDVIFNTQGDVGIDDRDELDAAYTSGELTKKQYEEAIAEAEAIKAEMCVDIAKTEIKYKQLLDYVLERIEKGSYYFCNNPLGKLIFINEKLANTPNIYSQAENIIKLTGVKPILFDCTDAGTDKIPSSNEDKDKIIREYLNKRRDVEGFAVFDINTDGYKTDEEIRSKVFTPENISGLKEAINTEYTKKNFRR